MSTQTAQDVKTRVEIKDPGMWKVVIFNDDATPVDFVVMLLGHVFNMSPEEAADLTWTIHHSGQGVAGVFTHEIAEEKNERVQHLSRLNGFALRSQIEPES